MDQEGNEASKKQGGNESDQRDNAEQNEAQNENEAQVEDDQSWNQCMIEYESDDENSDNSLNSAPSSVQGKTEEPVIPPPPVPHMEVSSSHVPLIGRLSRPPEPAVQDSANQESTPSLMGFTSRPLPVPGRIEPVPLQEGAVSSGVLVQTDSAPQTDSSAQTGLTLPDPMTPSVDMSRDESANVVSEGENQSTIEVVGNRDASVAETITESMEDPLAAFSSPFVPPIPARPRPSSATRPQPDTDPDTPQSPSVQQDISSSENSSPTREFLLNLQKGIGPDLRNSFSAVGRNPMAVGTNQTPIGNVVANPAVGAESNPLGTTGVNIGSMPAVNRNQNPSTPAPEVAQQSPASNDGNTRRRTFLQRLFSRKRKDGDSQGAAR